MPLYDFVAVFKGGVERRSMQELLSRLGHRAFKLGGVVTDIKSFGRQYLAYPIKKRDGRHYQAQLMQMTMMVPPKFHEEMHYLNKDERLLRWILVKHRGTQWLEALQSANEVHVYRPGKDGKLQRVN